MTSTSETGHAKNVANFEELISYCTGYGVPYDPTNANTRLTALNAKKTEANAALQLVKTKKAALDTATNARELAFATLNQLSTRVINALDSTVASKQTVEDARVINRKITGRRAKAVKPVTADIPTTDPASAPKHHSVSQQSYDSLADHFAELVQMISGQAIYAPNETDLQVTALNTYLSKLRAQNIAVKNAIADYSNARIARDKSLYTNVTGLVAVAGDVKKYVKSVFGATSPQYKQVSGLRFQWYRH